MKYVLGFLIFVALLETYMFKGSVSESNVNLNVNCTLTLFPMAFPPSRTLNTMFTEFCKIKGNLGGYYQKDSIFDKNKNLTNDKLKIR